MEDTDSSDGEEEKERERDGAIVHECVCEKRKTRTGGE